MSPFGILLSLFVMFALPNPGHSATLESPADGALLSGLGFISGWKCDAGHLTVRINGSAALPLAMHQPRQDTSAACGGAPDNGFVGQVNWALLGDGKHTITVYDDDVSFASATFEVVTLNQEFIQGAHGSFEIHNFPTPGDTAVFQWNESTQHMELASFDTNRSPVMLEPVTPSQVDGRYPTRHVIHGFDVWVSPTVYESPDYTPAVLERELAIIRAQLLWATSHDALPPTAIQQIIDSGVSIYLDTPSNPSAWWCGGDNPLTFGCYDATLNRVGIPIVDAPYYGGSYLQRDHTNDSRLLSDLAYVYYYQVLGGYNVCITQHFSRVKKRYAATEEREQGSGGWWGPLSEHPPMHERVPPGPWRLQKRLDIEYEPEYFAEASEAMFSFNRYYPWNRNELWHHDPDGFRLIWEAWHDPDGFCPQQ